MKIYDEFSSKVRSATYSRNLNEFIDKLCKKMGIVNLKYSERTLEILRLEDPAIMDILRSETQLCILLMREKIEEKKEEYNNA